MSAFISRLRSLVRVLRTRSVGVVRRYRGLRRWQQIILALVVLGALICAFTLFGRDAGVTQSNTGRFVTLATVGELSGSGGSVDLIGTVRSITEADILAQSGGTVTAVHTRLGGSVPAGTIIASLENAAERAAVLQAEGAYDAAVAARSMYSLSDTEESARDTYRTSFTSLDTVLANELGLFFGVPTAVGPEFLLRADSDERTRMSRERARIRTVFREYEDNLETADTRSPQALLNETESLARELQTFLNQIADIANRRDANATPAQIAGLAAARTQINSIIASVTTARSGLRTGSIQATAGADASVKQALGMLRAAQANLERTVVRAPIGGQVTFLPIRVGDYVTPMQHVATVAQSGALEIVAYVAEQHRDLLVAGSTITVADEHEGIITSVAPALDPTTKQIEVRVAVRGDSGLLSGQSVHLSLPDLTPQETVADAGPVLLPLASVKLRAGDRIVFSVDAEQRLVAHAVEVGTVRGDRIEILSPLPTDLRIVSDARGLTEGEQVRISNDLPVIE